MLVNLEAPAPAAEISGALNRAFAHFNAELFDGRLPAPVFNWQRKKNCRGHFIGGVWSQTDGNRSADEISLNPDTLQARSDRELLSTLVHEMCHQEQHHHGKPSRSGYHNREWVVMMERVGLIPSNTGEPGGKQTGQKMTHYIDEGGAFDAACAALLAAGWVFPWKAMDITQPAKAKAKDKAKFTCPDCQSNAWAKESARIICGDCDAEMERQD